MRVGLPSNHPQFCVALATHRQYYPDVLQPAVSAEHRVWASPDQLCPRNSCQSHEAWRVQWRREPRRGGHSGRSRHSSPLSLVRGLAQGASPVLPATRLARADGPGRPVLIILFLAHSGCFWPSF